VHNLNGIDSKFRLAILVARRAKQLIGGAKRKIEIKTDNPLTVSMEEFRQGKIDLNMLYEEPSIFGEPGMEAEAPTGETGLSGEMVDCGTAADAEEFEAELEADAEAEAGADAEDEAEGEAEAESEMVDEAQDSQTEPES
jgi:DNA-directed RNA polymerase omega subunit